MGYKELIGSLRKESEEKVLLIWQEAEAEAEKIRAEAREKIQKMRKQYDRIQASAVKEQTEGILAEADKRARMIKLSAEKSLADRLYLIAVSSLHLLRNEGYKTVFKALIQELPDQKWHTVRVNPEDAELVKTFFPDSEIIPDGNITGGLDVTTGDGRARIINTFEKRLERAWMDMIPGLIRDVYKEVST